MKAFLLASILAAAAAFSFGAPAQAAATVTTYHRHYHPRPYHVRPHCYVKTIKHYRHGRVWYEKVRVCR